MRRIHLNGCSGRAKSNQNVTIKTNTMTSKTISNRGWGYASAAQAGTARAEKNIHSDMPAEEMMKRN
jgi:hypothetical protein